MTFDRLNRWHVVKTGPANISALMLFQQTSLAKTAKRTAGTCFLRLPCTTKPIFKGCVYRIFRVDLSLFRSYFHDGFLNVAQPTPHDLRPRRLRCQRLRWSAVLQLSG